MARKVSAWGFALTLVVLSAAAHATTLGDQSTGINNTPAPGSSKLIGIKDGTGNLQPVSAANPVPSTDTTTQSLLNSIFTSGPSPVTPAASFPTYQSDTYLHIASGTACTQVKNAAGTLSRISINAKGASANTITVYDNPSACSGTVIAGPIDGTSDRDHTYGLAFLTGLSIQSATGTGADMTVGFR